MIFASFECRICIAISGKLVDRKKSLMIKKSLLSEKIHKSVSVQTPKRALEGKSKQDFAKMLKKAVREGVFPPPQVNAAT